MTRRPVRLPGEQAYKAQVAALPVRSGEEGLDVLLITSRESRRWVIPKGWPMKGLKDHQAAAREAMEEAGVAGKIHKHPVGAYTYQKRLIDRVESCRVMVYRLEVEKQLVAWREKDQRRRKWFSQREAAERITEPALATLILSLQARSEQIEPANRNAPPETTPEPSGRAPTKPARNAKAA